MVKEKKILLCVTGGIAVFKAAALTSKLSQEGAIVKVVMTESAKKFVTPLTFQALSRQEVYDDTFAETDPTKISHIDLADWADVILVAPATANMIGKLANGIADDMISTILLATTTPVWIAPAMNVHMYDHPAVQANMERLAAFGYHFIEPDEGFLACGYVGKGRLSEPEQIIETLKNFFGQPKLSLLNKKRIIVTAGPTQEKIDPVRYFTNRSSGKMGYAIAEEAAKLGAIVTLVSGPTRLSPPKNVTMVQTVTAEDMYQAVLSRYDDSDVVIKAAAVADYRPKTVFSEKMKKQPNDWVIEMERTKDILATLGNKKTTQLLVGFAAETEHVQEYAIGKMERKNLDLIVANNVAEQGSGFQGDTNIVTIFKKDGSALPLPLLSKTEVAKQLLNEVELLLKGKED